MGVAPDRRIAIVSAAVALSANGPRFFEQFGLGSQLAPRWFEVSGLIDRDGRSGHFLLVEPTRPHGRIATGSCRAWRGSSSAISPDGIPRSSR